MRSVVVRSGAAVLAVLFLLAIWQSRSLAERRQANMPEAYIGYTTDVPPILTFVIAGLGGFRGIVTEVLWFRANRLQEQGRYLELVQLADWITMLDPHAAEAWAYNAWNLAYNVSIMMVRPADRLRWVQNGIALLRDEGLRFNPKEARLYRELAWLYQNKVGDSLDQAHLTYKLALAEKLAPFLRPDGTVNVTAENRAALASLRLDIDRMAEIEKRFGPVDWRLAETHAIYWADQGVSVSSEQERLLCRRGVYQPLVVSVFHGRFAGSLEKKQWRTEANLALALKAADYIRETLRENPSPNMTVVAVRFLALVVQRVEKDGLHEQAKTLYGQLTDLLPVSIQKPTFAAVVNGWEPPDDLR